MKIENYFSQTVREKNGDKYLRSILKKQKKVGGYINILNNNVVLVPYLTGHAKEDRDRFLDNQSKGIVSFDFHIRFVI